MALITGTVTDESGRVKTYTRNDRLTGIQIDGVLFSPLSRLAEYVARLQTDRDQLAEQRAELQRSIRQVADAVLANWRNNDGSLTVDTIHMLQALARLAGCADLF